MDKTAIILPVHNEALTIALLCQEVQSTVFQPLELILVDDGSTDGSLQTMKAIKVAEANSKKVVVLSRNFGQQQAIMEGLRFVSPDCLQVVVMDSDFQDKPRDIPLLLRKLREGYDCAFACRQPASGSYLVNRLTNLFYWLQSRLTAFPMPKHAGTFCAFNRTMLERLLEFSESEVYFPGLRAYVGLKQVAVQVQRGQRASGASRVGFLGLVNLSLAGLVGFSALPMRAVFLFGLLVTCLCLLLGLAIFILRITGIIQVLGFASLAIFILGLFGIQITFTGLVGEYIGKLFIESKRRPRAIVREVIDT